MKVVVGVVKGGHNRKIGCAEGLQNKTSESCRGLCVQLFIYVYVLGLDHGAEFGGRGEKGHLVKTAKKKKKK